MRTLELFKVIIPNGQSDRQPNRAPKNIPPANPIPELEYIRLVDSKASHSLRIRAKRDEMFRDVRLTLGRREEPATSRLCVCDRLRRGKSLAGDINEQRSFWIAHPERFPRYGSHQYWTRNVP